MNGPALVASVVWLIALSWLVSVALTLYGLSRQKSLEPLSDGERKADDASPLVSVLVPARNEEHRVLADCIGSILAQDYERFEVIAVNDRSTDATGEILGRLAQGDPRLRLVEGAEPPEGWLGKPYALEQAMRCVRGEWILATDADMLFHRAALRTAVSHVRAHEADALTLIPRFQTLSFWERVMIPTWSWVLLVYALFYRVHNPRSRGAIGIGGFFLLRRSALERLGGYPALKDEVMEDVRLAEMLKASGARVLARYAPRLVSTRMYTNFREMWECSTKNWFSGMKFSLPLALSAVCSMYLMTVAPPVIALASLGALLTKTTASADADFFWRLFVPAALSWAMQMLVFAIASRWSQVSPVYALTAPLGPAVLYAMLFDSSIRITTGRGVMWKGRRVYERDGVRPPRPSAATQAARSPSVEE